MTSSEPKITGLIRAVSVIDPAANAVVRSRGMAPYRLGTSLIDARDVPRRRCLSLLSSLVAPMWVPVDHGRSASSSTSKTVARCGSRPSSTRRKIWAAWPGYSIEESFQTSKGQTGLDEHQVRTWKSWYRWSTLVQLAHAFLAIVTVSTRARPAPAGLIPLALNEIRRLYNALALTPAVNIAHVLHSSYWRRRHQYHAQQAHYQRQSLQEP